MKETWKYLKIENVHGLNFNGCHPGTWHAIGCTRRNGLVKAVNTYFAASYGHLTQGYGL